MGDVYVELELENYEDRLLAERGHMDEKAVRKERIKALVDTGATLPVLPEDMADALGLRRMGKVIVTYADERREQRDLAGVLTVRVGDRSMETRCVVGPPGSEPLLGHVVLEVLDLVVDPKEGRLVPRPESPYLPTLKLKKGMIWRT
ncbi:MAG: clan AA aspartic protease [Candidatus Latescibacterota bacterium]|nr:MAG: clan AA aspartic protease [Candidatus Latescibacterota bacterium]HDI00671.1 clan AA aspartic protease [Bacillota bacterium]